MSTFDEIGRVIGTEKRPNTAYTFFFWTQPNSPVGIGSLVKVVAEHATVYGVVVEAQGFNDLESPLHEFLSVGGEAGKEPPTHRPEMRVFQAAVLRREPEDPIGAVPIGRVFLADPADVQRALRFDAYAADYGIPAGCYGRETPVAVMLHSQFLLGPEAGHLNMTGTSGLAAKTSFILFLLKSIFAHAKDEPNATGGQGVAALLFNTKGGDLLYIDQPPQHEVDPALYVACAVPAEPFDQVRYFAPFDKDGFNLNTLRRNPQLEQINPTSPFSFGLKDVIKHAEVLLNRDDLDAKADAYLQYLNDRFVESKDGHQIGGDGPKRKANSLRELVDIIQDQLKWAEAKNATQIESHSALTARKMYNRINNLGGRFAGVISEGGLTQGPFSQPFKKGTVYVVDVAGLDSDSQNLVFAGFITTLREKMEAGELGVGRLVVMVDELNKYAPSGGAETYVVRSLREIASRGRYLGLTLFGAQQFRSRVDKEIVGNAATHAFGHIEAEELAQPGYSYFSPAVKEKLGALKPGEILLKHPHFAQPVFLNFPVPACMRGQDGLRAYPQSKPIAIYELIVNEAKRRGADVNAAKQILDGLSDDEQDMRKLLRALRNARPGDDPAAILRTGAKRPERAEKKTVIDDFDPFKDLA